jgi:hypothetical protein
VSFLDGSSAPSHAEDGVRSRPSSDNQRLLPRQKRRVRVALGRVAIFTTDVSPGGFCAEMIHALAPGSVVTGSIVLSAKTFPFEGQVVWSKAGEPRLTRLGRIGVRFTNIENRFFQAFQNLLLGRDASGAPQAVQGRPRRDPETP